MVRFALAALLLFAGCDDPAPERSCGEPAVPVTLAVETNAGNVFIPAPHVQTTWSPCGVTALADDKGEATAKLGAGQVMAVRLSGEGLLATHWPEFTIGVMPERHTVRILRESMRAPYRLTSAASLLWITVRAIGACEVDGTTIEVVGHPEARLLYINADGAIDEALRSTSSMGVALVHGLPEGTRVRAIAHKPGCSASSGRYGAVMLEAGTLSAMPIELR